MTGVDRVEKAYLDYLLIETVPLYGLVRSAFGYLLLDQTGCAQFAAALDSGDFGEADSLSKLKPGLDPNRAAAETFLRRICVTRCLPFRLGKMLKQALPDGAHYLNVGHSNLTDRVVAAIRRVPDAQIAVMVHDTIPLDFPQYQRPETAEQFGHFLARVSDCADVLICNSEQTKADVQEHIPQARADYVTAHLGVPLPELDTAPAGPWQGHPYFLCIGTIEPRKNHGLLLDLWKDVPDAHLILCGQRGWRNADVFDRLDQKPARVHELPNLTDPELFALLADSNGLLFPSHAEGYGLPPIEATALGVPVLCNTLPVYREVLGDIPVYASCSDRYLWLQEIKAMAAKDPEEHGSNTSANAQWSPPGWEAHFKTVLTMI